MGNKEVLQGPPTLMQDIGLPHCILTAVSAGRSGVCSGFITGLIRLGFTILHSGATINDGDKSKRSNVHSSLPLSLLIGSHVFK